MDSLHEQRLRKEKTAIALEALIDGIYQHELDEANQPAKAPLEWRVSCQNRLVNAGITLEQATFLEKQFRLQERSEKTNTKTLMEMGAPIERIVEYISAPTSSFESAKGVAIKESIYNQIKLDHHRVNQVDIKQIPKRVGYGLGAMAFVSSWSLILVAAASTDPNMAERAAEAGVVFDKINHLMWGVLDWAGIPGADLVSSSAPLGQLTALCGSLAYSEFQRNRGKAQRANLRQKLHQPTSGLSEELFGQSQRDALESRYELLTENDKHLLNHLSSHELRVVLLGNEESAKDILRANPPPFENEVLAAAHSSSGWGEHFSKMLYLALPKPARKVVDWVSSTKPLGIERNEPFYHDDSKQMLDRLHKRRQQGAATPTPDVPDRTSPLATFGR